MNPKTDGHSEYNHAARGRGNHAESDQRWMARVTLPLAGGNGFCNIAEVPAVVR